MRILDKLKIDENVLVEQHQKSKFYLTTNRLILYNDNQPDYKKMYSKEINQYGEILEDWIFLEL